MLVPVVVDSVPVLVPVPVPVLVDDVVVVVVAVVTVWVTVVTVGVVFGGTPQLVLRVPEHRPLLVLAQETGQPRDIFGFRRYLAITQNNLSLMNGSSSATTTIRRYEIASI